MSGNSKLSRQVLDNSVKITQLQKVVGTQATEIAHLRTILEKQTYMIEDLHQKLIRLNISEDLTCGRVSILEEACSLASNNNNES